MTDGLRSGSISIQVPTEHLHENPELVESVHRQMEKEIRQAGCMPDPTSWRREDATGSAPAMTTFVMSSATSLAHIVWHVSSGGYYSASSSVVAVVLTGEADAQRLVDALNKSHGYEPDEDGEWDDAHYYFRAVPVST